MKRARKPSPLVILFFLVIFPFTFSIISVEARKNPERKSRIQKQRKQRNDNGPDHVNFPGRAIFDVFSFGAEGDGVSDDSKALLAAWKAACKIPGATVKIPSGFEFLIKPITLQGPCMPPLVLQVCS
ncbi:hypothetical protein ACSBR2_036236 [Camellia fascicularis]